MDVDGYLIGELNGKEGYIPSNLLEEVTDQEELAGISTLLQAQANQRHDNAHLQNRNGIHTEDNSSQKMKAVFDYDPALDSPNENSEVELTLNEGDIVMVFGKPDEDGFFKVFYDLLSGSLSLLCNGSGRGGGGGGGRDYTRPSIYL